MGSCGMLRSVWIPQQKDNLMRLKLIVLLLVSLLAMLLTPTLFAQDAELDLPITEDTTYVVQPRDTLDGIGGLFDVDPICLAERNDIRLSTILEVGQELLIAVDCPNYFGAQIVQNPREVISDCDYVVQRLDTLSEIAFSFDISVISLQQANELFNKVDVRTGMCLTIPENAPPFGTVPPLDGGVGGDIEGEVYVMQPGDTIDEVAFERNVSTVSILVASGIGFDETRRVMPGTTIIIPDDAPPFGVFPALTAPSIGQGGDIEGVIHVVQRRETLDGITALYNKNTMCVMEANEVGNPRHIQPGDAIFILDSCGPYVGFAPVPEVPLSTTGGEAMDSDMDGNSDEGSGDEDSGETTDNSDA